MAFDYKKEYKELYRPLVQPGLVEVPPMNFLAVRGEGDPNEEEGEYSRALTLLYGVAYALRMSSKGSYVIEGFFEYVVPPLEGFWWQEGQKGVDYSQKGSFHWISLLRLPEFVSPKDVEWAKGEVTRKKKLDSSLVEFFSYNEGICVQSLHLGAYDDEPATVLAMEKFANAQGYETDISSSRYHHEIYLSDPRKTEVSKRKTIVRHPIKKLKE